MRRQGLRRCGLAEGVVATLGRTMGVTTPADLLLADRLALGDALNMSLPAVGRLIVACSGPLAPSPVPVSDLRPASLPTHLPSLDEALRGGIPCGALTELVGAPGVGKTQLCYTLVVINHRTRPPGTCIWVDTENAFDAPRLLAVAQHRFPDIYADYEALRSLAQAVEVWVVSSARDLEERLASLEEVVLRRRVSLVVVDSIAAAVRRDFGPRDVVQRQAWLGKEAAGLKTLAEQCGLPVVLTSHMLAPFSGAATDHEFNGPHPAPEEAQVVAALGTAWAHSVNVRLVLDGVGSGGDGGGVRGSIRIAKAPMADTVTLPYAVGPEGVVEVHPEADAPAVVSPHHAAGDRPAFEFPNIQHATAVTHQRWCGGGGVGEADRPPAKRPHLDRTQSHGDPAVAHRRTSLLPHPP